MSNVHVFLFGGWDLARIKHLLLVDDPHLHRNDKTVEHTVSLHFLDGNINIPRNFLAITRHHRVGEILGEVDMIARSFAELPQPSRTLGNCQTCVS